MFIFNSLKLYFLIVPFLCLFLLIINLILSNKNVYAEKTGPFECGFSSFKQSRNAFSVAFILIAILFLPFDLEVSTVLPLCAAIGTIQSYGIWILFVFIFILVFGFIFEINKKALHLVKYYKRPYKPLII